MVKKSLVCVLAVLVLAAGCSGSDDDASGGGGSPGDGGEPQPGGVLTTPLVVDPNTLDLMQEPVYFTQEVAIQMYDTLVRVDPEKLPDERVLVPSLATEWEVSEDATEITLTLREGVTFHDGEPFTSDDVRATIERIRDAPDGTTSYQAGLVADVTVETPDDVTAVLRSESSRPGLLMALSSAPFVIVPAHVVEEDQHALEQNPVGTGPFEFGSWDRGSQIELVKNEDYWREGIPYLDGIKFPLMPDLQTRTSAYISGNVLLSGQGTNIPAAEWSTLEQQVPGTVLQEHGTASIFQTFFNNEVEPFDDARVREAFALVMDQELLGTRALEGFHVKNSYGFEVGSEWSLPEDELADKPTFKALDDDVRDEARALLADAGYEDGLEIDYLVAEVAQWTAFSEIISAELAEIGVTTNITVLPLDAEATPLVREGRYQMAQHQAAGTFVDPCLNLAPYTTAEIDRSNFSRYSNPEVDDLHEIVCTDPDEDARRDATLEIQRILWEDIPTAISPSVVYIQGFHPTVKGVTHPGTLRENMWYETVWLDD